MERRVLLVVSFWLFVHAAVFGVLSHAFGLHDLIGPGVDPLTLTGVLLPFPFLLSLIYGSYRWFRRVQESTKPGSLIEIFSAVAGAYALFSLLEYTPVIPYVFSVWSHSLDPSLFPSEASRLVSFVLGICFLAVLLHFSDSTLNEGRIYEKEYLTARLGLASGAGSAIAFETKLLCDLLFVVRSLTIVWYLVAEAMAYVLISLGYVLLLTKLLRKGSSQQVVSASVFVGGLGVLVLSVSVLLRAWQGYGLYVDQLLLFLLLASASLQAVLAASLMLFSKSLGRSVRFFVSAAQAGSMYLVAVSFTVLWPVVTILPFVSSSADLLAYGFREVMKASANLALAAVVIHLSFGLKTALAEEPSAK